MKRSGVLVAAAALLVASCGVGGKEVRVGPLPTCDTTSRELIFLMAQAVPTAEYVPCLESLPPGWELERTRVETGRAALTLDNPGIGDVDVILTGSCNQTGQLVDNEGPPGSQVYETVTPGFTERRIVFAGGCLTIEMPSRPAVAEMTAEISFLSREELQAKSDFDL